MSVLVQSELELQLQNLTFPIHSYDCQRSALICCSPWGTVWNKYFSQHASSEFTELLQNILIS